MVKSFPIYSTEELFQQKWEDFEPCYIELQQAQLQEKTIHEWLAQWTQASEWCDEFYNRAYVAVTTNTVDEQAESRFKDYMEGFYPHWQSAEQRLKEKLLESGLQPEGMQVPLRNMRAEADLFREENLPLQADEENLNSEHDKIIGAQSVVWQREQRTARQMEVVLRDKERETRRAGWELLSQRQLQDREAINDHWQRYMNLRAQLAANAQKTDYRAYVWQRYKRFDYTPGDCKLFQRAIEEVVVPAVARLDEGRRQTLGVESLRYYDLFVDPSDALPLAPFKDISELKAGASAIFQHVHPAFGEYFDQMDAESLLDLENRINKANGGYCTNFAHSRRPFIFANAVGIHDDVQTLLHEGGHAFHAFESARLPYFQQSQEGSLPTEFCEVASMGMEFLSMPYLGQEFGGYYSAPDAARARMEKLETDLRFWPYMAIVDAFQHWAYENPEQSSQPEKCDQKWAELESRFRPGIDWNGYEDAMMTGWQRKDHIHQMPFYYVEYGLALLGAAQIWRNSLSDQAAAVRQYQQALALGGTETLPALFHTAGARLAFDAATLKETVYLMTTSIENY